jgi:hypothetical protein
VSHYQEAKKPPNEDQVIATMASSPTPHALVVEAYRAWDLEPPTPLPGCACPLCTQQQARGPRLGQSDIDAARTVPLLEVASRLGLGEGRRAGADQVVLCPMHGDSKPSLRLNARKGLWFCDPCGVGGDAIGLVCAVRGIKFKEAVSWLVG